MRLQKIASDQQIAFHGSMVTPALSSSRPVAVQVVLLFCSYPMWSDHHVTQLLPLFVLQISQNRKIRN
jgi:hypothetical protein